MAMPDPTLRQEPTWSDPSPSPDATLEAGTAPWAVEPGPQPRATSRSRRMVNALPGWEPLPPGEVLVRRHRAG